MWSWGVFVSLTAGYVVKHRSEPHVCFQLLATYMLQIRRYCGIKHLTHTRAVEELISLLPVVYS